MARLARPTLPSNSHPWGSIREKNHTRRITQQSPVARESQLLRSRAELARPWWPMIGFITLTSGRCRRVRSYRSNGQLGRKLPRNPPITINKCTKMTMQKRQSWNSSCKVRWARSKPRRKQRNYQCRTVAITPKLTTNSSNYNLGRATTLLRICG